MRLTEGVETINRLFQEWKTETLEKERAEHPEFAEESDAQFLSRMPVEALFVLSIGSGSLKVFSELDQIRDCGIMVASEQGNEYNVVDKRLACIPKQLYTTSPFGPSWNDYHEHWTPDRITNKNIETYKQYKSDNATRAVNYYISWPIPKIFILAIDEEFGNERTVGHATNEGTPIQVGNKQLHLRPSAENPHIAYTYNKDVVCVYVTENLPSKYKPREREFYGRVRRNLSLSYAEECVPDADYPLLPLIPMMQFMVESKNLILVHNDAWWHQVNPEDPRRRYSENYYFENICEIPYIFMHEPFLAHSSQIYYFFNTDLTYEERRQLEKENPKYDVRFRLKHFPNAFEFGRVKMGGKRTRRKRSKLSRTRRSKPKINFTLL